VSGALPSSTTPTPLAYKPILIFNGIGFQQYNSNCSFALKIPDPTPPGASRSCLAPDLATARALQFAQQPSGGGVVGAVVMMVVGRML
jgi:hypothetical protein